MQNTCNLFLTKKVSVSNICQSATYFLESFKSFFKMDKKKMSKFNILKKLSENKLQFNMHFKNPLEDVGDFILQMKIFSYNLFFINICIL